MDQDERYLMIQVAIKYYLEDKIQSQIAKELYLSRTKVSRLLTKARLENIVEIKINYDCDALSYLKNKAISKFPVEDIIVINRLSKPEDTLKELGKAASEKLFDLLHDDIVVGISWGRSVRTTVEHLRKKEINNAKVVELFGAISYEMDEDHLLSIGSKLAEKISGQFYPLPAPLYIADDNAKKSLINTPIIKNTLEMNKNCDFILTGIGVIGSDIPQKIWDSHLEDEIKEEIALRNGIGFLCAHFFDDKGKFLDLEINENIIGIDKSTIEKTNVVCIGSGIEKAPSIRAALKGGYIHTLIIDDAALEKVLEIEENN